MAVGQGSLTHRQLPLGRNSDYRWGCAGLI